MYCSSAKCCSDHQQEKKLCSKSSGTETVIPNHQIFTNWLHILPFGPKVRSASEGRMGDSAQGSMEWIGLGKTSTRSEMAQCITCWPLHLQTDKRSTPPSHLYMIIKCSLVCFLMVKPKTFFCSDPLCSCQVVKMPFFFNKTVKDVAVTEKWSVR